MKKIHELMNEVSTGAITHEEYMNEYRQIHHAAMRGDMDTVNDLIAFRKESAERSKEKQDWRGYVFDLEQEAEIAETGAIFSKDPSYLETAVACYTEAADYFWNDSQYEEAAKRYPAAMGAVEKYGQKYSEGKYAQKDFLSDFYARCAFASLYAAQALAEQRSQSLTYQNMERLMEKLVERLKMSKAAFEKIPDRQANDTYYYLVTLRMLLEFDNSSSWAGEYFMGLTLLEKDIGRLDPDLRSDLYIKLAEAYESGYGVKQNERKAAAYIKKAGKAGNTKAKEFSRSLEKEKRAASVKGEYALRSKGSLVFELIVYALFFIGGIIFPAVSSGITEVPSLVLIGLIFAGIPAGWRTLTKITPSVFVFLPVAGWALYFLIKGGLSLFIGWAALPFRTVKCARALRV